VRHGTALRRTLALLSLVPCFLAACATTPPRSGDVLDEVWETVRTHFYDPTLAGVDWPAARERARATLGAHPSQAELAAAIDAMLAELHASHTAYFKRDDPEFFVFVELFWEALEPARRARAFPDGPPALPGIGILSERVVLASGERASFVRGVLAGGPAEAAGIDLGDRLLAVEGEPFEPVASFRTRVGVPTRVRIQRSAEPSSVREVTLLPEALSPRALFLRALRSGARIVERDGAKLGYAHVWSYAGEEFQVALRELLLDGPLQDADGLVLDLRGGFGGANPEYLNLFRRDLPELEFTTRDGERTALASAWSKPTVLLIDEGTTSGKEIFAHGFQRARRGPLVGARSAGAVLGGQAFLLADGSLLYLAVQDVRVDGERLEGRGIEPDVPVSFARPFAAGADPQRERAQEVLQDLLRADWR
jgi:carboxyl-terminal processing protease